MMAPASEQPGTIADVLAALARDRPGRLALAVARHRTMRRDRYEEVSLSELERDANALAGAFAHRGIVKGTRTLMMIPPGRAFCAAAFGLLKLGAIPVFIDPAMGLSNVSRCIRQVAPGAFVGSRRAQIARRMFGWGRESVRVSLTVDSASSIEKEPAETPVRSEFTSGGEMAAIAFTSGSTGVPKGVVFNHGNLRAQAAQMAELLGPCQGRPHLATFPLFLLYGPVIGLPVILPHMDTSRPGRADPSRLITAIKDYRCESAFASPVIVRNLGGYCREAGRTLPTLERVLSAGAPSDPKALAALASVMSSSAEIFTPYGATEALPVSNIGSREILGETAEHTRRGAGVCVGAPVPGITASIVAISDEPIDEWNQATLLATGEVGEITVAGDVVSQAYFDNPDATRQAKVRCADTGQVHHRTGDLGYVDARGRLWMCGRKSHRVVTADRVYFSVCCEGVFNSHPAVARTALVGMQAEGGTVPAVCVELASSQPPRMKQDIVRELRELGAQQEMTRPISRFLVHPGFPVDARHNSKIRREALAVWAASEER